MGNVLWKAASFLLAICAGFILRRRGVFGSKDYVVTQRIMLNLTSPAAIIISFADFEMDLALLGIAALGLVMNVGMMVFAWIVSRRKNREDRALYLMNFCGYNVGSFAIPFLQNFVGSYGVALACLFDVGNAPVATGGGYVVLSNLLDENGNSGFSFKTIGKRLLHVMPFLTYIFMIVYNLAGLPVPDAVLTLLTPAANANAFVSMLIIGLMVDLHLEPGDGKKAAKVIALRAGISALVAAGMFFLLPVDFETRCILTILAVSPISALSASFSADLGASASLSAAVNSIYALVSVAAMSVLVVLFGVA